MSGILLLVISIILFALAYVYYAGWLAKQWGLDVTRETPAHTMYDGVDYVPAKAPVLLGHPFRFHSRRWAYQRTDLGGDLWLDTRYALDHLRQYILRRRSRFWVTIGIDKAQGHVHRRDNRA